MKIFIISCLILLCALLSALCISAEDTVSQKLYYDCELDSGKILKSTILSDNDYTTKLVIEPGDTLRLYAENCAYLYIKFYASAPNSYNVKLISSYAGTEDKELKLGQNGFLHDLTKLDITSDIIEIASIQQMTIAEIELYSQGELPKNIQRWENSLSACDILVISTHADDDTLFFGALIAENTAVSRLVQTAFICDHGKEPHRLNELLDGQWTLGATAYPIIGNFPDLYSMQLELAESQYDTDAMRGFIVESIRRTKPSVVVTHDVNGEYGHGAHRLVSKLTREAVDVCSDYDYYSDSAEKYGVHSPKKTYLHLYEENPIVLDVDRVYLSLTHKTPFETAKAAYACHVSQHKWKDLEVTKSGTNDCRRFGLYKSETEFDKASNDIMSGIMPIIPCVSSVSMVSETKQEKTTAVNSVTSLQTTSHDQLKAYTHSEYFILTCIVSLTVFSAFVLIRLIKRIRL